MNRQGENATPPQRLRLARASSRYALVTLHRPSNVDDLPWLRLLMLALAELNEKLPVVFPAHPRSRQRISDLGLPAPSLHLIEPQPYLAFLALQRDATLVITDSGGIQEETSFLGVPCLTVRENTERPITVALGTNVLVGRDVSRMQREAQRVLAADEKKARSPIPLWDGNAADRIAKVIAQTA